VKVSVVFPAYNEELRIIPTLEEAVAFLDEQFGRPKSGKKITSPATPRRQFRGTAAREDLSGYEIIIVNDGSKDKTVEVALEFSRKNGLHDILRVITLEKNRGKGGGVTHGFRHVRGEYVLFADADGASRFSDLGRLIDGCEDVVDGSRRGVAIGSRAHLVGSEAVVQVRSKCGGLWEAVVLTTSKLIAFCPSQLPNEILSSSSSYPNPPGDISYTRYSVRF
jgi:dolichyl-phosphate beta-glucosyltransferase